MRTSQRLVPLLLLLLQATLPITCSQVQEEKSTISRGGSPQPSLPAQPSAHDQRLLFEDQQDTGYRSGDGAELVEKALVFLRRYEAQHPRFSTRRSAGVLGVALRHISYLLPSLNFQGPEDGDGKEDNYERRDLPTPVQDAVQLLETAARLNNSDALFLLAEISFYGNFSVPVNYTEAFRRYQQLASLNGNSSAQHMIGFMYATGIGNAVERDQAKALLYYTFAARGGNERSEMAVAFRYQSGIGTMRNCEESMKYYKSVADKAIDWYRSGPPGGMAWVPDSYRIADEDGGVYGEGASFSSAGSNANKGGPSSDAYAALDDVLEYLDLMSRKGDFKATFSLGRIHYDGQKGLPRNLHAARRYFMTVAKQYWQSNGRVIDSDKPGLEKFATKAAGYLGRMFMRGEGVELSYEKANIWFNRGVKGGDAGSQYGLGLLYLHGLGVPKNTIKATEYFKAAADQDYPSAQVQLGALYLDQGTAADIGAANRYFELAARYNHIEALYFLAELINHGVGRERSCGLANAYYKTVAEKAEPLLSSFAEANEAFENGSYELALVDYILAAEQGWEKAQVNVAYLLDQQKSYLVLPSWLTFKNSQPSILQNAALALVYWTRSAKQANIDSMVKMGDYYLNGVGTEPDMEKAAACYTGASEFHQSAQALYNLGWMHENGVGLDQDFHLAKRLYDQALETNEEAYLPVTLSLIKLRIRSAWNTLTHGRINSIQDEPEQKRHWSFSEWIANFLQDDYAYYGDGNYDESYLPDNDPMPGGDADGLYEDIIDDGVLESFIIIGLAAALVFLVYYRQQRQAMHRREEARAQGAQGMDGQQPIPQDRGFFPQPGDPEFNQWLLSTPAAKRRRVEAASKTLARPFRSPFKTPHKSDQIDDATHVTKKDEVSPNNISPAGAVASISQSSASAAKSGSLLNTPDENRRLPLSPASRRNQSLNSQDPEITSLIRAQRALEKQLQEIKNELETAKQAKKIESESKRKHPNDEIDRELVELIAKWKTAGRQAAEELFGMARDRVNRMGGPRAWKESQKKQQEFQNAWQDEEQVSNADNDNEGQHNYDEYNIDPETDTEKAQRIGSGDDIEIPGQEDASLPDDHPQNMC
ncbi:hypothetical protein B7463_g9708, partial [Scytalidium lignicola]